MYAVLTIPFSSARSECDDVVSLDDQVSQTGMAFKLAEERDACGPHSLGCPERCGAVAARAVNSGPHRLKGPV